MVLTAQTVTQLQLNASCATQTFICTKVSVYHPVRQRLYHSMACHVWHALSSLVKTALHVRSLNVCHAQMES